VPVTSSSATARRQDRSTAWVVASSPRIVEPLPQSVVNGTPGGVRACTQCKARLDPAPVPEMKLRLETLDVESLVPVSVESEKALRSIITGMAARPKAAGHDDETVAEGSYLPKAKKTGYYAFFHIDRHDEDDFFLHLGLRTRPPGPPPTAWEKAQQAGHTVEKLEAALRGFTRVGDGHSFTTLRANMIVDGWERTAIAAAPVKYGTSLLRPAGIEFHATEPGGQLRTLRWSTDRLKSPTETRVWLTVQAKIWEAQEIWPAAENECRKVLEQV
jgi:hypothetical protein